MTFRGITDRVGEFFFAKVAAILDANRKCVEFIDVGPDDSCNDAAVGYQRKAGQPVNSVSNSLDFA